MKTSYLRFRLRLARHALLRFAASLQSSLEYLLLAFAPVLLGLFACIALPGLFAATLPWPQAAAVIAAQTLFASAPVWLLRKRLHPASVLAWSRPLPIPAPSRWTADAAVAAMLVAPLSAAYALSTLIWLHQWPDWLRPVAPQALMLTVASLLLAWLLSTLTLAHRARPPAAAKPRRTRPPPTAYAPSASMLLPRLAADAAAAAAADAHADADADAHAHASTTAAARPGDAAGRAPLAYYWRQLFWLPFWRAESVVGVQQTLLLAAALLSVGAWMWHPPMVPPAVWGACAAIFTILLTYRGDQAVGEQIALLRPITAGWPLRIDQLYRLAIGFTLLPALCVLAGFAALTLGRDASGCSHTVATVWLCCTALAHLAIVCLRQLSARGRVGLVFGAILILTAIGSELWN